MPKIQTILALLCFLFILFSMDMIFGNPIRETFSNQVGLPGGRSVGFEGGNIGSQLNYKPNNKADRFNGDTVYSGKGFLAENEPRGDDQPLFFSRNLRFP
jgi:hypothetical protein